MFYVHSSLMNPHKGSAAEDIMAGVVEEVLKSSSGSWKMEEILKQV